MRNRTLLALLLGLAAAAQAGITGKITGTITDTSGEPLPGVNVILLETPSNLVLETATPADLAPYNTRRGAASDFEGDYILSNISPGIYVLEFSSVGYSRTFVEQVVVSVDLTSRHDVVMQTSAIEGEVITITAERPLVQVDQTFSASYVGSEELSSMPVTELNEVVQVQAGVVDGHFRGGRSGEVLYLVDGIPVTDVYDGGRGVDVQVSMVQELQVISGTFNAEYGQAMSGVVNTVTKDGGEKLEGSVSMYSGDYFSNHTEQFMNIDELDPLNLRNLEFSLSGPIPGVPSLSFSGTGRYFANEGWYEGVDLFSPQESYFVIQHPVTGNESRVFNTETLLGIGELEVDEDEYYIFAFDEYLEQLLFDEYIGTYNYPPQTDEDRAAWREFGQIAIERSQELYERSSGDKDGAENVRMNSELKRSGQFKLTWEHTPTSKFRMNYIVSERSYREYAEAWRYTPDGRLNRYSRQQNVSLKWNKVFGDNTFLDASASNVLSTYNHKLYDDIMDPRYRNTEDVTRSGFYYYDFGGINWNSGTYDDDAVYVGTANIGGTENEHFYRRTSTWQFKLDLTRQMGKIHLVKTGFIARQHVMDYDRRVVSFDGNNIVEPQGANSDIYTRYPWEGAMYLQDKMEFQDITLNVGVRLDVFDANWHLPYDLTDLTDERIVDTTIKYQFSPRIAVAYPITDTGVIHFSYGHFFQRPSFEQLYRNPDFEWTGQYTLMGNPDLKVERTVQYEIGLQQQIGESASLDVSIYSRDIRDLVSSDRKITMRGENTYYIFTNRDFGTVQGVAVTLDQNFGGGFSAGVDYTWQIAKANASNADAAKNALEGGGEVNKYLVPLDWDRRHTLNLSARYQNQDLWGMGLLGTYGSGLPYTLTPASDDIVVGLLENGGRKPTYMNMDLNGWLNLERWTGGQRIRLTFQVKNLFDRLNENNVFARTGRAGYNLDWESTFAEQFITPTNYSRPREVIVGFQFSF